MTNWGPFIHHCTRITLTLGVALFSQTALWLQEPASASESESELWENSGPSGRLKQDFTAYTTRFRQTPNYQERIDAELEFNLTRGAFNSKLLPWGWAQIPHAVGGKQRQPRFFGEVKEGWVEWYSDDWEIRIGNQIVTWGTADRINPTDLFNPRDYYDPFRSEKLPRLATRLNIHPESMEKWNLSVIATPFFRESKLPH